MHLHAPAPVARGPVSQVAPAGLVVTLAALVVLQVSWPLTDGALRGHLTVAIVIVFALACVVQAAVSRGLRPALTMLGVAAASGYSVEVLGVHTGVPFGSYAYSDTLGPALFGVPLVVALAWTMMTWPAAVVARRLTRNRTGRVLIGAWAATAGDVFLDPQLVAIGGWMWADPDPHLPGVNEVPLSNFGGWLLVTVVVSVLLQATMGDGNRRDDVGYGLFLWSWVSWTVALAVFLDQPAAAAWGALAMGVVAVPLLVRIIRPTRETLI